MTLQSFVVPQASEEPPPACHRIALAGMPEICLSRPPVAWREFIPWLWIYVPVVFKWLALSCRYGSLTLPTASNPYIESGGFRGESKSSYLQQIGADHQRFVARWTTLRVRDAGETGDPANAVDEALDAAGLAYPVILKPDIGTCGLGVRVVRGTAEAATYCRAYPAGQRLIVQEFIPWPGEAGAFYVRMPGEAGGRVYSLGLRYFPHVVGDGRATLAELIAADPRARRHRRHYLDTHAARLGEVPAEREVVRLATVASLRVGALYCDGAPFITEALTRRLDSIARSMPEFYYGRFDIKFADIDLFARGEAFRIIEVNGAGAEAIHVWDPLLSLREAYRVLFEQHDILFAIAARNRARGFRPLSLRAVAGLQWRESRLIRRYPPSN